MTQDAYQEYLEMYKDLVFQMVPAGTVGSLLFALAHLGSPFRASQTPFSQVAELKQELTARLYRAETDAWAGYPEERELPKAVYVHMAEQTFPRIVEVLLPEAYRSLLEAGILG